MLPEYQEITIMSTPWIPIFTAAFIPYFTYFIFQNSFNNTLKNIITKNRIHYLGLCIVMGMLYFGSLILFSYASSSLGKMGAVITWPMLMIFIILTSNCWSFIHREWQNASTIAFIHLFISFIAFIIAILLLSLAAFLKI